MTVKKKREYLKNRSEHINVLRNELAPGDPVWILSSRGMRVPGQLVSIDPINPIASVVISNESKNRVMNICMLDIMDDDDVLPIGPGTPNVQA